MSGMMCDGASKSVEICRSLRTVHVTSFILTFPLISHSSDSIPAAPWTCYPCMCPSLLSLLSRHLHLFSGCCSLGCPSTICSNFCPAKFYSFSRSGLRLTSCMESFQIPMMTCPARVPPEHLNTSLPQPSFQVWFFLLHVVSQWRARLSFSECLTHCKYLNICCLIVSQESLIGGMEISLSMVFSRDTTTIRVIQQGLF